MPPIEWSLLLLIVIANGTPVIVTALCGEWWNQPMDGGRVLTDRHRVLGASKTWRGFIAASLASGIGAVLLGLPVAVGMVVGIAAMSGDLLSSFIKRRLGISASGMALGLDQLPEAVLPLLAVADQFGLTWSALGWTAVGFMALELGLSPLFYWLGVRNRPY
jgi:CDP-archaeol synthase